MYNQEDLEALELFNTKAEILRNSSFLKFLLEQKSGITIAWEKDKPITTETRWPDDEATRAFILTFRFFYQDNERCSIRNIAGIYDDLPISERKKDWFENSRSNLNKFLDSESPAKVNNETITRRDILEMFMYGELAHVNRKKKELLDRWMSHPLIDIVVYNEFIYILSAVLGFIEYIRNLNEEVMKELSEKR